MGDPIDDGYRMPPEWALHTRCWMAWPCHETTFPDLPAARNAYAEVARAIARFEAVTMIANPAHVEDAQTRCGDGVEVLALDIDDSWARDTGPIIIERGAIHTDGRGTLLTTENVVLNPNRNPGLSGSNPAWTFFCPVALSVASVRPWNESLPVITVRRSGARAPVRR